MVKRNSTRVNSNNCLHWWGEKFASWIKCFNYKILPVHRYHDCNPNDQENSHKLRIRKASSKNRKMNFHLEIKQTVNSSWFRVAMWPKHNNLKSKWSREKAQAQVLTTSFIDKERNLLPEIKKFIIKYCQCTMTAI